MKKVALIIFFGVSIGDLFCLMAGIDHVQQILKPLIMTSLGAYYVASSGKNISKVVIGAIFFSFLGDTFLMLQGAQNFMFGLVAFLIAHVCYIFAYRQHKTDEASELHSIQKVRYALPIVLASTGLLILLYPHLGQLLIPVIVYALVMMVMVLNALFRIGQTKTTSFWFVFSGSILFMISDALLAINKFMSPFASGGLWIMLTYIVAQFLIVEGLIRHKH